jgi:hypothetical protein
MADDYERLADKIELS